MPVKWKLFGLANYFLALFFTVVFVFAMKAFFNPQSGMKHLEGARLITLSIFIMAVNAGFNIYIFHRHLPDKPLAQALNRLYIVSTILYTMAAGIILFKFIPDTIEHLLSIDQDPYTVFDLLVDLALLLTAIILFIQYTVLRSIENRYRSRITDQLEDLGK